METYSSRAVRQWLVAVAYRSSRSIRAPEPITARRRLLVGASFVGVNLYEASLVKTDFTGVRLAQFDPPVFVDRGPGLMDAVESDDESTAGAEFVEDFGKLLRSCGGPST